MPRNDRSPPQAGFFTPSTPPLQPPEHPYQIQTGSSPTPSIQTAQPSRQHSPPSGGLFFAPTVAPPQHSRQTVAFPNQSISHSY
nr:MAG TPA: hypothetical protein [Caudoviricetes sp.]